MTGKGKGKGKSAGTAVINVFPELFGNIEEDEKAFFREKYGKCTFIDNGEGIDTSARGFHTAVCYNSCVLFGESTAGAVRNGRYLSEVASAAKRRVVYRKNRHFAGSEYMNACRFDEVIHSPKKRVMIAIPCYSFTHWQTMKSVYDLIIPEGVETEIVFMSGYTVVQARNRLVEVSLAGGFDFTLFVDSDVILPNHLLFSLMAMNTGIATGWYIKKIPGGERITELYGPDRLQRSMMVNILESELPRDGSTVPVTGCGFGCTLVSNEVFRKIGTGMWFEYVENRDGISCSEDLDFCIKAQKSGCRIAAHTGLRCAHIGTNIF